MFNTAAPGTIAFNLSESPAGAQREIEIARIDLTPSNFSTGGFKIGPITIEPPHIIHDLRLVHGERLYGVFSDATHFQIPAGAADFFAVGFDGSTASQQFESNSSPINGTLDPVAGTFSLDLVIGDPTTDGAEATFHGTLSNKPSYNCAAGIAPVFAPLNTITVEPCYENASVMIPLPRVSDLCTPHSILISGQIVSVNGHPVSPLSMPNDLVSVASGQLGVLWTATDANGSTSTAQQTIIVQAKPALYALGKLEVNDDATVLTSNGAGATIDNGGTTSGDTTLHHDARSGSILSVPGVKLLGSTVTGSVRSSSNVQNVNAIVTGWLIANTLVALPPFPSIHTTFPAGALPNVTVYGSKSLSPGSYGDLIVSAGTTLSLSSGIYTFNNIHVSGVLKLDTMDGPIELTVQTSVFYDGAIQSDGAPARFILGYVGTQPALIHAAFSGVIIAPQSSLQLGTSKSAFTGAFYAAEIHVFQGAAVTQAPFACTVP